MAMTDGFYREAPVAPDLADYVRCVWYRRLGPAEAETAVRVTPDGCIDLLWMQGELVVAGPDTRAHLSRLPLGAEIVGFRFRPGAAPPVLGVPADELLDQRLEAAALLPGWARQVGGRLEAAADLAAAGLALQEALRQRLGQGPAPDPLVRQLVTAIQRARGDQAPRVDRLAEALGLSERQLHRRCRAALGYGPRTFGRIVRFRRALARLRQPHPGPLADLAASTGYADQPHLTREVQRLAGLPPAELAAELVAGSRFSEVPAR